jgi:TusA-related sulfurtransferase/predicted peroxiredoxin
MTNATSTLERRGKTITTFVVYDAAERLERMEEGERLEIITDSFEPIHADIAAWCQAVGHQLVESRSEDGRMTFLIEKRQPRVKQTSLAMVISNAGLEELLSPLGFALAAALEGTAVHLYFQGPAVRVLAKGYRPKLRGWGRPFSRFAAAGMEKTGHVSAQRKLQQLASLGAHIYLCGPSLQHFKVDTDRLILPGLPQVEYLSFVPIMEKADIQIYT